MIKYYDISENLLDDKPFEAESIYCCADSGTMYFDSKATGSRIKMGTSDIILVSSEENIPQHPIPNKLYCVLTTGRIKIYHGGEWINLGGAGSSSQLHFKNIFIDNSGTDITDNRISASDTAVFYPDISVADLITSSTCVCSNGSCRVTVQPATLPPVPGELIIN